MIKQCHQNEALVGAGLFVTLLLPVSDRSFELQRCSNVVIKEVASKNSKSIKPALEDVNADLSYLAT
jgi:hypothetical protein